MRPAAHITAKFSPAALLNTLLYYFYWHRRPKFGKIGAAGENLKYQETIRNDFFLESPPPPFGRDAPPISHYKNIGSISGMIAFN